MKYFIDTEFIEGFHKPLFGKRRHFIDLISIGIIAEDGREYYAISTDFKEKDADGWVYANVICQLPPRPDSNPFQHYATRYWKSDVQIAKDITNFVYSDNAPIEFYGYYADYDWVLLCSLFGKMIDLPTGFPMYCIDLKQTLDKKADLYVIKNLKEPIVSSDWHKDYCLKELKIHPNYPIQTDEHNALSDARWNNKLYEFLQTL
jgi:hypothetical protein